MPLDNFLGELQELSWNDVAVPCLTADFNFEQQLQEHRILYQDASYFESMGKGNSEFSYTIPFRNGVTVKYKDLPTVTFRNFLKECQKAEVGTLVDPLLGTLKAKVKAVSLGLDANKRDGFDVKVTFVETPNIDSAVNPLTPTLGNSIQYNYIRLDEALSSVPTGIVEAEDDGLVSPQEYLAQVAGAGLQPILAVQKAKAEVDYAIFQAKKIKNVAEQYGKAGARLLRAANDLLYDFNATQINVEKNIIKTYIVPSRIDIMQLAQIVLKMDIVEFRKLNPTLTKPIVDADTVVYYSIQRLNI